MVHNLTAERSIRTALSRHPVAVECAHAASTLGRAPAEVVVFEEGRSFVVASSLVQVLQPRVSTAAEAKLVDSGARRVFSPAGGAFAITGRAGETIGSLTLLGEPSSEHPDAIHSLARVISTVARDLLAGHGDASINPSAAIVHGLRDAVVVVDANLDILWANEATGSLVGRTPADVIGTSAADLLHPDDLGPALDALTRLQSGLEMYRIFVRISRPEGSWELVEVTGMDNTDDPRVGGVVLSLRSADAAGELEATAERALIMSGAVVANLHDGIVATDEFNTVTLVNAAARRMFSLDPDEPASRFDLHDFTLIDESGHTTTGIELVRAAESEPDEEQELCIVSRPGELRYVTLTCRQARDRSGSRLGTVLSFHDITRGRLAAEELRHQALHDQLTGLPNRRQLEDRLRQLSAGPAENVATCFVDIDGFKLVNDTHGHRMGDRLIRIAADRLTGQLTERDLLVRQGGDEFVAVLVGVADNNDAAERADKIRRVLADPYMVGPQRFDLTASVGVSVSTTNQLDDETELRQADIALYAAKARGRNRTTLFDEDLAQGIKVEEQQRTMLRHALDDNRIIMHFQPLVHARTGATFGYEALVRLRDERGHIVGPASFLGAAENSGLMWEVDALAFELSCHAAAALRKASAGKAPVIACNFSSISLLQPSFLDMVLSTVETNGVSPEQICIEITESAAFDAGPAGIAKLQTLHRRGFTLALDDFGTGYSSLAHLRDLPISSVKVDRSFVSELTEPGSERAIAEAVVSLAHDLGLGVVAEGVETHEQLLHAQELGFGLIQGWHYSPALPLSSILSDWLTR